MIRSAGVANGDCRRPQILEWSQPGAENRTDSFVALQIDAANLSSTVIQIEVTGYFFVFRFDLQFALLSKTATTTGRARDRNAFTEVLCNIGMRSKQTLLFTSPETDTDGATRFQTERLDQSKRFQTSAGTSSVVGA